MIDLSTSSVVVGDVNGRFEVFATLEKQRQKGHRFAFAIVAGNLFADPVTADESSNEQLAKLLNGEIEVAFPTYFALGNRPLPSSVVEKLSRDQGELCPNLSVLGRKVSFKTLEGFKIVAIGGNYVESQDESMDEYAAVFSDKDVESAKEFKDADLLITSEWPAGVVHGSEKKYAGQPPAGVRSLGELCAALRPRYHFSTSEMFFERDPFFHPGPRLQMVTRFISIAPSGNSAKQKQIYAFNLEPSRPAPPQFPPGTTASPFIFLNPNSKVNSSNKRKYDPTEDNANGFRFSNGDAHSYCDENRRYSRKRERRGGNFRDRQEGPRECYFCLSNQSTEGHMVASIGEEAYITIAKGPLTKPDTFPDLKIPCHMLIIPIEHAPTVRALDSATRESTYAEMNRYREALHTFIASKSTSGADGEARLGAVTFQISKGGGVHMHWQFLPMPVEMIKDDIIEAAFDVEAENKGYSRFAKTDDEIAAAEEGHFFKVMIWSESKQKEIVMPLDEEMRFDLQFGRRVLGKLLVLESRGHWKDVVQSTAEETKDTKRFKKAFKPFDFAAPEDAEDAEEDA